MVGMRDVAKKAGVSLSTVSLVVNGNGYVSNDMRDRVRKAMQALNYVPNELARNLYHDRTNLVGVIVPTIRHPFFATFTAHLQHALAAQGLRTMLCSTTDETDGEIQYVDMLRRHMMDGIVMCVGVCDRILVMSGGRLAGEVDAKTTSQEEIMRLAAKYV